MRIIHSFISIVKVYPNLSIGGSFEPETRGNLVRPRRNYFWLNSRVIDHKNYQELAR